MKKVVLNFMSAPKTTSVIKTMLQKSYNKTTRPAYNGSGDTVGVLYNPLTKFTLEYTIKRNAKGENYVNWCRVFGPVEVVDKFLQTCGIVTNNENAILAI